MEEFSNEENFCSMACHDTYFVLSGCKSVESSSSNNEPPPAETMANERNNEKKML